MDYSKDLNEVRDNEDLHSLAGLLDGGVDEDGNIEWIGSKEAWNKYEELLKTQEEE